MDGIDKKYGQRVEEITGQPEILVRLELRLHDNGSMSIVGPVDNTELCVGILEHALETMKGRHFKAKKTNRIEIPNRDVVIGIPLAMQGNKT